MNKNDLLNFYTNIDKIEDNHIRTLEKILKLLMDSINKYSIVKETNYQTKGKIVYQEFYPRYSKEYIDEIDVILAQHYGFTEEELDFIINYDIKYRMGDELDNYIEQLGK